MPDTTGQGRRRLLASAVSAYRLAALVSPFLAASGRVEGEKSERIALLGNDLRGVRTIVDRGGGFTGETPEAGNLTAKAQSDCSGRQDPSQAVPWHWWPFSRVALPPNAPLKTRSSGATSRLIAVTANVRSDVTNPNAWRGDLRLGDLYCTSGLGMLFPNHACWHADVRNTEKDSTK